MQQQHTTDSCKGNPIFRNNFIKNSKNTAESIYFCKHV